MFDFNDYDSYQAFKKDWRKHYAKLSNAIRVLRTGVYITSRSGAYAGGGQSLLMSLRRQANDAMTELRAAKDESAYQRSVRLSNLSNSQPYASDGEASAAAA